MTFQFNLDSLQRTGFHRQEVSSAYVVRYANQDFTGARDTIRQESGRTFYPRGVNLTALPAPTGATNSDVAHYSYRIAVPAAGRQYDVTALNLDGETGTGCCACYRNTRRRFTLNGQYTTADGSPGITALTR